MQHQSTSSRSFHALPPNAIAPPREARRRQQRRMHMLICTAMVMSVLLYSSTAYWGYMTFGGTPSGNALADYATLGPCGSILNNALAASQLASLPLLIHEGVHESIALSAECLGARPVGERLHPTKQDSAHHCIVQRNDEALVHYKYLQPNEEIF